MTSPSLADAHLFSNLDSRLNSLTRECGQMFVVTDDTVASLYLDPAIPLLPSLLPLPRCVIPHGAKGEGELMQVWRAMSDSGVTRRATIVALGGGTVTDLAGFAAATFKRGVACVNIPTTLLAMVDASVGGKTGIDFNGLKNEVGAFAMPRSVLTEAAFLRTLPPAEILSGFAEMLKTGLIADAPLYASLMALGDPVDAPTATLNPLIERCMEIKQRITAEDPHEKGLRKILNFGHTVGHAFESRAASSGRPVAHGVAVAWGLLTELVLSHFECGLPSDVLYPFAGLLRNLYPPFPFTCGRYDDLLSLMSHDKKNPDPSAINFTLLSGIGHAETDYLLSPAKIIPALDATLDLLGV